MDESVSRHSTASTRTHTHALTPILPPSHLRLDVLWISHGGQSKLVKSIEADVSGAMQEMHFGSKDALYKQAQERLAKEEKGEPMEVS